MTDCIATWVTPLLGAPEVADPTLMKIYADLYPTYAEARRLLGPAWAGLASMN